MSAVQIRPPLPKIPDPTNMKRVPVPQLDAIAHVADFRVFKLAQKFVHALMQIRVPPWRPRG